MAKEISQTERQLEILRAIPTAPRKVTVNDIMDYLSSTLNVQSITKRTIQRDMEALERMFGISVEVNGKENYYFFPVGSHISLKKMGSDLALGFLLMEKYTRDLLPEESQNQLQPYFKEAAAALTKERYLYKEWEKLVAIHPKSYPLEKAYFNKVFLLEIYKALLCNKQIKMNYTTKAGEVKDYTINPHGVVQQQQVSYLIANYEGQQKKDQLRQFTLHRINSLELSDVSANRLTNFDIRKYLSEGGLDTILYPEQVVEFYFSKAAAQHLYETPLSHSQVITELDDGRLSVKASITITQSVKWWLLGFGDQVEIISPKALREEMMKIAESMLSLYK